MSIGIIILNSVVGLLVVIAVLAVLAILITLVSKAVANVSAKSGAAPAEPAPGAPAAPVAAAPAASAVCGSRGELVLRDVDDRTAAILMAIVADQSKIPLNELRFVSITCVNP